MEDKYLVVTNSCDCSYTVLGSYRTYEDAVNAVAMLASCGVSASIEIIATTTKELT